MFHLDSHPMQSLLGNHQIPPHSCSIPSPFLVHSFFSIPGTKKQEWLIFKKFKILAEEFRDSAGIRPESVGDSKDLPNQPNSEPAPEEACWYHLSN